MAYTLAEATAFYDAAKAAYLKCLNAEDYTIKDRSVRRAKLDVLKKEMTMWKNVMDAIDAGNDGTVIPVGQFVPRDL